MELGSIRHQSLDALKKGYRQEAEIVEELFSFLEECAHHLNSREKPFERVCSIIVMKTHRYGLGIYYLILDGIGQEAGALYRPLFEAMYMLIYIQRNPTEAERALRYKLPSYTQIANRVSDRSKELDKVFHFLSEYASHFTFKPDAIKHIVDLQSMRLREIEFREADLLDNLRVLTYLLAVLAKEAVECLRIANTPYMSLAKELQELAKRLEAVFYSKVSMQGQLKQLIRAVVSQIDNMARE